jgi:hypothetical protein
MRLSHFLAALLWMCASAAGAEEVVLDYRLQPDRDVRSEMVTQATTSMRVVEDRGLVAKSNGRLSAQALSFLATQRQSVAFATGKAGVDGSFAARVRFLSKSSELTLPDGSTQPLPDRASLAGARLEVVVERDGTLRKDSAQIFGASEEHAGLVRDVMVSVVNQAASMPALRLAKGQSTPQDLALRIPLPGVGHVDMKMRIHHRLIAVEDGVARIDLVYSMDFGGPTPGVKMSAHGTGGGTMRYDLARKLAIGSETRTMMKFTIESPDGVLEMEMVSQESQSMRVNR